MVEHLIRNEVVGGSNPSSGTKGQFLLPESGQAVAVISTGDGSSTTMQHQSLPDSSRWRSDSSCPADYPASITGSTPAAVAILCVQPAKNSCRVLSHFAGRQTAWCAILPQVPIASSGCSDRVLHWHPGSGLWSPAYADLFNLTQIQCIPRRCSPSNAVSL